MHLLRSISDSPTFNCALEEYLLTERPFRDVLLFYINRPSVIVGRNQKIEAEVNTEYCRLHGIEVIKRISGGGTVYHDDLTVLKKTLQGDHTLRGRSVASVSSPVTNLSVYRPEHETTEEFLALLCQFFEGYYQTEPIQPISTSTIRNVKQLLEEKEQTTHQIFE